MCCMPGMGVVWGMRRDDLKHASTQQARAAARFPSRKSIFLRRAASRKPQASCCRAAFFAAPSYQRVSVDKSACGVPVFKACMLAHAPSLVHRHARSFRRGASGLPPLAKTDALSLTHHNSLPRSTRFAGLLCLTPRLLLLQQRTSSSSSSQDGVGSVHM